MLSSLQIENVAVIQKAEVHFEPGLNVPVSYTHLDVYKRQRPKYKRIKDV